MAKFRFGSLAHPGMCEHGKDLFLPWHRAEFYYFEKILQGADPDFVAKQKVTTVRAAWPGEKAAAIQDVSMIVSNFCSVESTRCQ